ncbi:MAG: hypothetical protein ACREPV_00535 [Lysobacter sp.]
MDFALGLLAIVAALASALALYLASPNRGWRPGAGRAGLRAASGVLALVSLGAWIALIGVGAGLCAMLATWMLALVALPYLAWWTSAQRPLDARRPQAEPVLRVPLEND